MKARDMLPILTLGDTGLEGGLMVYMTATLTFRKYHESDVGRTPILFLKIFDKGNEIYNGTMKLNDTVQIDDKTLGFYDIKYWSNFYVVKDDRIFIDICWDSGLMILALLISFFIVPKRIWVEVVRWVKRIGEREIHIGGKSDKFRSFYEDEFSDIVNRIKERITNGTN